MEQDFVWYYRWFCNICSNHHACHKKQTMTSVSIYKYCFFQYVMYATWQNTDTSRFCIMWSLTLLGEGVQRFSTKILLLCGNFLSVWCPGCRWQLDFGMFHSVRCSIGFVFYASAVKNNIFWQVTQHGAGGPWAGKGERTNTEFDWSSSSNNRTWWWEQ